MSKPASTVICGAGPFIHLDELGCLSILENFASILIPDQVRQEFTRHRAEALAKPSRHFQSIEAREFLTSEYDWCTEGVATAELQDARQLLKN